MRFLFCPVCLAGFDSGCTVTCRYTHIPVMFSLYCFVSKFLSSFSKYCDFNYFRHVWSSPAAGSELLVLTYISQDVQRVVRYLFVLPQFLTITFPSHPYHPRDVGNICGFWGFLLEAPKESFFPKPNKVKVV